MQSKSPRGVQQHEVAAAADALLAEGARPTVERVRLKLGRGSPNTVGPMLETWFASLAPRLGLPGSSGEEQEGAPPTELRQALADLWMRALGLAHEQAESKMQEAWITVRQERAAVEAARAEVAGEKKAAAERGAALEEALRLAKVQLEDLQARLAQSERQLAQARATAAGLAEERDAQRQRADAQAQAATQERQTLLAREQATERRLLEEVDRARQETKHARAEAAEARRREEAASVAHDERLRTAVEAHSEARMANVALQERLGAAERRGQELLEQLTAARAAGRRIDKQTARGKAPRVRKRDST